MLSQRTPGTCPLTPRELEAVAVVGEGLTYKQTALRLKCGWTTVRSHLHNAYVKLGAPNAAQAYLACVRAGWIEGHLDENPLEAAQLVKLERLLTRIVVAIERRREKDVTLVQRRYLDRFEEHLRSGSTATADRLSVAFGEVCTEAGVSIERKARQRLSRPPLAGTAHAVA